MTLVSLGFSFYLVLSPILPQIEYYLQAKDNTQNEGVAITGSPVVTPQISVGTTEMIKAESETRDRGQVPIQGNKLIISKIGVNGVIFEGKQPETLNKGFWHRPGTGDPEVGGNFVITGHRFMYSSGPKTFYHLDKLIIGDVIKVFWKDMEYNYQVFEIQIVEPSELGVEASTPDSILTLYTCTPLWTAKQRLVVKAKLIDLN